MQGICLFTILLHIHPCSKATPLDQITTSTLNKFPVAFPPLIFTPSPVLHFILCVSKEVTQGEEKHWELFRLWIFTCVFGSAYSAGHLNTHIKAFKLTQVRSLDFPYSQWKETTSKSSPCKVAELPPKTYPKIPELFSGVSTSLMLFLCIFVLFVWVGGFCCLHKAPWLRSSSSWLCRDTSPGVHCN